MAMRPQTTESPVLPESHPPVVIFQHGKITKLPRIFWAHLDLIAVSLARADYLTASSLAVTAFTWQLGA